MHLLKVFKFNIFIFCIVIALSLLVAGQVAATTYYVSINGSDSNPGTESNPLRSIQRAADIVRAGDTVYIKNGTYPGFVIKNKSGTSSNWITFKPDTGETVIIDANKAPKHQMPITISGTSKYIEINGFKITDSNSAYDSSSYSSYSTGYGNVGIYLLWDASLNCPSYITIANNEIYHTGSSGIMDFPTCNNNRIIDNHIHDNGLSKRGYGIYITGDNNTIRGNTVRNGYGGGIQIDYDSPEGSPDNNLVENNLIYSNGNGDYSAGYSGNDAGKDRGFGIYLSGGGSGNVIQNNIVYDNYTWGIRVAWGIDTKIYNNTVHASGYQGINTQKSNGTVVKNNIFYGSLQKGGYAGDAEFSGSGGVESNNLIGINPLFVNVAGLNFNLRSNSPAIDAGAGAKISTVITEYAGNSKPADGDNDGSAQSNDGIDNDQDGSIILGDKGSEPASDNVDTNPTSSSDNDEVDVFTHNSIKSFKTSSPVLVDGNLSEDEWDYINHISFENPSRSDNNVQVYSVWDDDNLYFAYNVTDHHKEAVNTRLYQDDGVEIYIDTNNDKSTAMDDNDYFFIANINNLSSNETIEVETITTSNGYTTEIAIPWSIINTIPSADMSMGLLLGNNDRDNSNNSQFDWMKLIETGSYARPNLWGNIVMMDNVDNIPPAPPTALIIE